MLRLLFGLFSSHPRRGLEQHARPRLEQLEDREVLSVAAEEQLFVYLLNRARHDPVAYQQEAALPVSLAYVPPRPPLAVNDQLFSSSEFKAEEMATYNYFSHQSQVTGTWPNKLVRASGYPLPSLFVDNANYLESISYGWAYPGRNQAVATAGAALRGLIIDAGINPPGHRNHLLGIDWNANFREIGVGHASRSGAVNYDYWTVHTGYVSTSDVFLTGVVYNDTNGNHRYDLNEGLGGVTIQAGGWSTTTNPAGGWSLRVSPSASYTVTASGGAFAGTPSVQVNVGTANVEVDFISGREGAQVNFTDATSVVNHAPVLGTVPALTAMNEDSVTAGDLVSRLLVNVTDANPGAKRGVAVTAAVGIGTWQYFDGLHWNALGAVSEASARLLPDAYRLRFVPAANWSGQATLTYRAWDRVTGLPGDFADLTPAESVGGNTSFSETEATATLDVRPVNDAPVQPTSTLTLPSISRLDSNPAGVAVSALLGGASDMDGPGLGVAVIGARGGGAWQFSTDGGLTWRAVGAVGRFTGRLLLATDLVRFVPWRTFNGTASLTFLAWDQSRGTAGRVYPVPSSLGGAPFSRFARAALLRVNDAPTLGAAPALAAMWEDRPNAGNPVSRLLVNATDPDLAARKGVAVTAATGNGTWQYFNGLRWTALGVVSEASARLLPDAYRLRFVPAANWSGQATLTYRAWDRLTGQLADFSAAGAVGGHTSFSASEATTTLDVRPVNDAPVQPATALSLGGIGRLDTDPASFAVSSLLASASDVESGTALGVAVVGASGPGAWLYSTDGGQTWLAVAPVRRNAALLLRGTDLVRFVPAGTVGGTARLTFVAWDQSQGGAGDRYALPATLGGSTPFSLAARTAWLPVA